MKTKFAFNQSSCQHNMINLQYVVIFNKIKRKNFAEVLLKLIENA